MSNINEPEYYEEILNIEKDIDATATKCSTPHIGAAAAVRSAAKLVAWVVESQGGTVTVGCAEEVGRHFGTLIKVAAGLMPQPGFPDATPYLH